jgi:hypothetical protein
MIISILERSKAEKKFIGVWLYGDGAGFLSGYVKDYTNELFVLQHYTKFGKPDGLIVEKIENIESIDFENDYSRAMEYLTHRSSEIDQEVEAEIDIANSYNWQNNILEALIGNKSRMVTIHINKENFYSGLVEWCDGENLILSIIGTEGQDEGKSVFKIEDINSIRVNDLESRKKLLLYKWRKAST